MNPLEQEFRSLLPHLEQPEIMDLLGTLDSTEIQELKDPDTGLVMLTALDCYEHPFHLGELLVTQAEVEVGGIRAHATVMGDTAGAAMLAAVLNALLRQEECGESLAGFQCLWEKTAPRARERRDEEMRVAATTKVAFENMAEEEEI